MRILYQASAAPVLPQSEAPTADRWYRHLAEPVRAVALGAALIATSGAVLVSAPVVPDAAVRWQQPLSLPSRGKPMPLAALSGFAAPTDPAALLHPEAASADRWWRPWTEPIRVRQPLAPGAIPHAAAPVAPVMPPPPETVTADKWFRPLAEPTRSAHLRLALAFPTSAYGAASPSASVPQGMPALANDRVLRSPGRRRVLATPGRARKLP